MERYRGREGTEVGRGVGGRGLVPIPGGDSLTSACGRSGTGMPMCLLAVVAFLFLQCYKKRRRGGWRGWKGRVMVVSIVIRYSVDRADKID